MKILRDLIFLIIFLSVGDVVQKAMMFMSDTSSLITNSKPLIGKIVPSLRHVFFAKNKNYMLRS